MQRGRDFGGLLPDHLHEHPLRSSAVEFAVENRADQRTLALIRQLREAGESLRAIAAELNRRGIKSNEGLHRFAKGERELTLKTADKLARFSAWSYGRMAITILDTRRRAAAPFADPADS